MPSFYGDINYRKNQSEVTRQAWIRGIYNHRLAPLVNRQCNNPNCNKKFLAKSFDPKKYCNKSCSASHTNRLRPSRKIKRICILCGDQIDRKSIKYCSLKCQQNYQSQIYLKRWRLGEVTRSVGLTTNVLSKYIRNYLISKSDQKCSLCGWDKVHKVTNKVPLEIDHIDGNHENNSEENLRLICPNCHSLTSNFRNLNKGKGRAWRMDKIRQQTNPSKTD